MGQGPWAQLLMPWLALGYLVGAQGLWVGAPETSGPGRVRRRGGPPILQGPNVCGSGFQSYCCPGWTTRPGGHLCVVPLCRHACSPGFCFQPNLCICANGHQAPSCGVSREVGCRVSCLNGGSCRGDSCLCQKGYTGTLCGQPLCDHGCHNGGRCIGPNLCACVYGFLGPWCERDYRSGPCFGQVGPWGCKHQLTGLTSTKTLCCATVGRAWGLPCEPCPAQPHPCHRGFLPNVHTGACQDVDECVSLPGLCSGGLCTNTVGGYTCVCPPGFTSSQDGTRCLDHRAGICYLALIGGRCVGPAALRYPRGSCCCERGRCWAAGSSPEPCPVPGSAEFQRLCPHQRSSPASAPGAAVPGFGSTPQDPRGSEPAVPSLSLSGTHVDAAECQGGAPSPGSFHCRCPEGLVQGSNHPCTTNQVPNQVPSQVARQVGSACYSGLDGTSCTRPFPGTFTRAQCCCASPEHHFGEPCEPCPAQNSAEFQVLCPSSLGFSTDGRDIDECHLFPEICGPGTCRNTPGTFECHCPQGYKSSLAPRQQCVDVDECEVGGSLCEAHASCLNFPGSFRCRCQPGWIGDGLRCQDRDECAEDRNLCAHGQCLNVPGAFRCECDPGFESTEDQRACQDVDECASGTLCAFGSCKNLPGTFHCVCSDGFALELGGARCSGVDECRHPASCINGRCVKTPDTYGCSCPQGFMQDPNSGSCVDTRVGNCFLAIQHRGDGGLSCNTEIGVRVPRASCCCSLGQAWGSPCELCPFINTTEHRALCPGGEGFRLSSITFALEDIDECQELPGLCQGGGCIDTFGSFRCECPPGYRLQEDMSSCVDVDECLEEPTPCLFGTCTNTPGTFQCLCPEGFVLSHSRHRCLDTRQSLCFTRFEAGKCSMPKAFNTTKTRCCCSQRPGKGWSHPCEPCPQEGSAAFQELCPFGHGAVPGPDASREDVNECAENPDICGTGRCINTHGAFRCECPLGYTLDLTGFECVDTDECSSGQPCGAGTCTNIAGGFECACMDGFEPGPQMACEDIDECSRNPLLCAFRCINTNGSYLCTCPPGYALREDGATCQDMDECVLGSQDCQARGLLCKNLIGSFACVCPPGLRLQPGGEGCTDADECRAQPRPCAHGRCLNTVGSFRCHCEPGFQPSPALTACHDVRRGYCLSEVQSASCQAQRSGGEPVTHAECCCGGGRAWGPRCELCPLPGTPAHRALCPLGSGYTADGRDVDECRMLGSLCTHGDCINSLGSFRCHCQAGFMPDAPATACLDVDECGQTPKPCAFRCHNTEGSFHCTCPRGFVPEEGGRRCGDLDECASRRHNCQFFCANTIGAFTCRCPPGFTQHLQACFDSDECRSQPDPCGTHAHCRNTRGSFSCECAKGFRPRSSGPGCEDVDECNGPHGCPHGCENEPGSYHCHCPLGFIPHSHRGQCVDENECALTPDTCGSAACLNTLGSFRCECPSGFHFHPARGGCRDLDECATPGTPCRYGCANAPGGFLCGCPKGFFRAGQGHCISSLALGPDPQDTPEAEELGPPKGCYECRIREHPSGNRARRSAQRDPQVNLASLDSEIPLTLSLNLTHLGLAQHILDLRPALRGPGSPGSYVIARGSGRCFFRLRRLHPGLTSLQLGRKPRPGTYGLEVVSLAGQGLWGRPLRLKLQLQVL